MFDSDSWRVETRDSSMIPWFAVVAAPTWSGRPFECGSPVAALQRHPARSGSLAFSLSFYM